MEPDRNMASPTESVVWGIRRREHSGADILNLRLHGEDRRTDKVGMYGSHTLSVKSGMRMGSFNAGGTAGIK